MKTLVCPNCGSNEVEIKDGILYCPFCGSKVILERDEKPDNTSISLETDIQNLLNKCKSDPLHARKYANLVLDIDPSNEEALKYL